MFETVQAAPPDAILGLVEQFKADPAETKVNLTTGVYKDETGNTPVLECVKEAERRLLDAESTKTYLPSDGNAEFCRLTQELYLGADHEIVTSGRAMTAQAPGGTGALRVAGDFISQAVGPTTIWCSTPTWPNHPKVFRAAGHNVESYPYYDAATHGADIGAMLDGIAQIPAGEVICLHACCHNPTGIDPTAEQWKQIADAVYKRGLLPLLDFAYIGFGNGIVEDSTALVEFARAGKELIVASSYSKNFGLYNERTGALTLVTLDADTKKTVASQIKTAIRTNYSNPPSHGGAIVQTVLSDEALTAQWHEELAGMRNRINDTRSLFTTKMAERLPDRDFSFIERQRGMFSYSGLTPEQVDTLREQHSIYIVRDGRINIAGITSANVDYLCDAIAQVVSG